MRLVHLGLGNFFRAHQAWYTARAPGDWGIAAFTGRDSRELVGRLAAQAGRYPLVVRGGEGDGFEVVDSLEAVHHAGDAEAWLDCFRDPGLAAVTLTVTEAGYRPGPVLDRLLAGLEARRRAGAGPIALVPCDNLPGNGSALQALLREQAPADLADWAAESVSFVDTVVDRITPRPGEADLRAAEEATGLACAVVTEPFHEWVLAGDFPAGRPEWDATFTADAGPFEQRKLRLLNGAHSLLAYAGSIRGHDTVAGAAADPVCRGWLEEWWDVASRHVDRPADDLAAYRAALLRRWANRRIRHRLSQIAEDGSQKLPARIVPVLAAERDAGRLPTAATRILAAWVCHLRGLGAPVRDVRAGEVVELAGGPLRDAVPRVLEAVDPRTAGDAGVVEAVISQCGELGA